MGNRHRLSRDQARRAKLKRRTERRPTRESLAYSGNRYKRADLAPLFFQVESAIHRVDVALDRALNDEHVVVAIETVVMALRSEENVNVRDPATRIQDLEQDESELVRQSIANQLTMLSNEGNLPPRSEVVGVLRTILGSIQIWTGVRSRDYLEYVAKFLAEAGLRVRVSPT